MASDPQSATINGKVIGKVRDISCDNFFVFGVFEIGPAYENFRELFDRQKKVSELLEQEELEGLDALEDERHILQEKIDALKIHIGGTPVRDFNLSDSPRCAFKFVL